MRTMFYDNVLDFYCYYYYYMLSSNNKKVIILLPIHGKKRYRLTHYNTQELIFFYFLMHGTRVL